MKKVGILGGTFNPIHLGHLLLAQTAYEEFGLDYVLIMPNRIPAYKNVNKIVSKEHRIAMVNAAICDNPALKLSTLEFEREGNTYTIDTINILTRDYPDTMFYFIMGADSLFHFNTWKEPEEILKKVNILVASRNDASFDAIDSQIEYLKDLYGVGTFYHLNAPNFDISSYNIRKLLNYGLSVKYMLPPGVESYIYENGLYQKG